MQETHSIQNEHISERRLIEANFTPIAFVCHTISSVSEFCFSGAILRPTRASLRDMNNISIIWVGLMETRGCATAIPLTTQDLQFQRDFGELSVQYTSY